MTVLYLMHRLRHPLRHLRRPNGHPVPAVVWWAALALLVVLAGCATPASREANYERWLSPWRGATEDSLRARWGPPQAEENLGSAKRLTYVATHPRDGSGPTVGISIGGFGFGGGGRTAVGGGVGISAPLGGGTAPTCTTHFIVEAGRVVSWTFEGPACDGPS